MSHLLVIGTEPKAPAGTAAYPRIEITRFITDIRHFSLYIQALQVIYEKPQADVASFWQISGIHGQPYIDWNGTPSGGRGYCAHGTDLFPTWHRPYVVLFEQEIQKIARQIAGTYTFDRSLWENAAASLRQPYWGWDVESTVVLPPQIISMTNVQIVRPNSPAQVSVPNPFLAFRYPAGANSALDAPWSGWPVTVRYPNSSGVSNPVELERVLRVSAPQLVEDTNRLYSLTTWTAFRAGSGSTTGLENIHGTVHVRTGGPNGNMGFVPVAAFDPIFYLHHAQVDRITELWYRRHHVWLTNASDLLPFRESQATYWKSPEISDSNTVFNYRYDVPINRADEAASEAAVAATTEPSVVQEWSVRVRCKPFELGGSFSVYVFLAPEVPANPAEWLFDPSFAGTFDAFVNSNPDECENCGRHVDELLKGFVHINKKFLQRSRQASLDPAVVRPYLTQHLSWAVQKANGEVIDLANFTSLEVTVLCTPLTLHVGAEFPVEGEPKIYPEITRGRVGGHRVTS